MNTSLFAARLNSHSVIDALPRSLLILGLPIAVGWATALAAIVGPTWLPYAFIASIGAFQLAMMFSSRNRSPVGQIRSDIIETPFLLSHDQRSFDLYRRLAISVLRISEQSDLIHRDLALDRIAMLAAEAETLSIGEVTFTDTETWRIAYERLLRSPGTYCYRSVAIIQTPAYWSDEPGRQSMRLNHELALTSRLQIKRIAVVADSLWPRESEMPMEHVRQWLQAQAANRIDIRAVRLSAVRHEVDLIRDYGIYGNRAVGTQETDEEGRTTRFVLDFKFPSVEEAEERWERLAVYATTVNELQHC